MILDPLPPSGDEYWKNADKFRQEVTKDKECEHYFVHKSSSEVECTNCRIGFVLSAGWKVKDGNLVTPENLVIRLLGQGLVTG